MSLVVLLKGINVGGHRNVRPSMLARELERFEVRNVGAAGTFVVRKPVTRTELRQEIERRLPFATAVMICDGSEIRQLLARNPFAGLLPRADIIQFVSVAGGRARPLPPLPLSLPARGSWCLRVLACHGRILVGMHRRQMKAIGYLGQLEKMLDVPLATRSWNTMLAVAELLEE